jgi:MerR family transcriptional regulator, light-induced transcriptional regulator
MLTDPTQPRYPVRVAAERSGVNPHLLRAWERRYRVVTPQRSQAGQRLYSDLDVQRLALLRQLTGQGHSISRLATLSLEELERIAAEDRNHLRQSAAHSSQPEALEFRSAAIAAAQRLDAVELQTVLERAAVSLGLTAFLENVAGEAIKQIGHGWETGSISVGQEHLATAVFRRVLDWILQTLVVRDPGARLVMATPPTQLHELGALLAAAAAAIEGWDVAYLGADLPVSEILRAASQTKARAVALSLVPPIHPSLVHELTEIRRGLGSEVPLFIGGAAVDQQPELFASVGARVMGSLAEFRAELRQLRSQEKL